MVYRSVAVDEVGTMAAGLERGCWMEVVVVVAVRVKRRKWRGWQRVLQVEQREKQSLPATDSEIKPERDITLTSLIER